jgi:hypothetical protein
MTQPARPRLTLVAVKAAPAPVDHGSRLCDPLDTAWLLSSDNQGRAARRLAYRLARHARSSLTPAGHSHPDERTPPCAAAR